MQIIYTTNTVSSGFRLFTLFILVIEYIECEVIMAITYERYLKLNIDGSRVGLERGEREKVWYRDVYLFSTYNQSIDSSRLVEVT